MEYILVKYLHYIGIFGVIGGLITELWLIGPSIRREDLLRLVRVDALYGISSIFVVGAGLLMWLAVGKPTEYYNDSGLIYIKLGMFSLVGLLSLYPTIFFIKNRKSEASEIPIPKAIRVFIWVEILLVFFMPILAILMSSGYSFHFPR